MRQFIPVAEPALVGNERAYVIDCLDSTWISSRGGYIRRFERAFAEFSGARHAIACSSGTAALHLALLDDPARRAALGALGRERALRLFTYQRMTEATLAAYAQFLDGTEHSPIAP
jgi:hypothetical protein